MGYIYGNFLRLDFTWAAWSGTWHFLSVRLFSRWTVLISFVALWLAFYDPFLRAFSTTHTAIAKIWPWSERIYNLYRRRISLNCIRQQSWNNHRSGKKIRLISLCPSISRLLGSAEINSECHTYAPLDLRCNFSGEGEPKAVRKQFYWVFKRLTFPNINLIF